MKSATPAITPKYLESLIFDTGYITLTRQRRAGEKPTTAGAGFNRIPTRTVCVLGLHNGATVTGDHAITDPYLTDKYKSEGLARLAAVAKLLQLEEYARPCRPTPQVSGDFTQYGSTFLDPKVVNKTRPAHIPATTAEAMASMEEAIKRFDAAFESYLSTKPGDLYIRNSAPVPELDDLAGFDVLSLFEKVNPKSTGALS
jgi:hypothetical protein